MSGNMKPKQLVRTEGKGERKRSRIDWEDYIE